MTTLRSRAKFRVWEQRDGPESIPIDISLCSRHARESSTILAAPRFQWLLSWLEELPQSTPSASTWRKREGPSAPSLPTFTKSISERHAATLKPHYVWKST